MRPEDHSLQELNRWISSREGMAALDAAARQVVGVLRRSGLHGALDRMGIGPGAATDRAEEEVRAELCRYVLENARRIAPGLAAVQSRAGGYLCRAFINHCRDLERRSGGDPFRSRYRQLAEAMRRDPAFFTEKHPGGGIRYSLSGESRPIAPLADEDLTAVGPPPDECTAEAGGHLHCARHFWQALQARFGGQAIWVDLRDMVRWLGLHGRLNAQPIAVALTDEIANTLAAPAAPAVNARQVRQWAAMFAESLSPLDRQLWFLRLGRGLSFKEIARETGAYSGPSGAQARIRRLQELLGDFIQTHDLPWLGPGDIDEEAWAVFYHALLAAVEKPATAPSHQGKEPPSKRGRRRKDSP